MTLAHYINLCRYWHAQGLISDFELMYLPTNFTKAKGDKYNDDIRKAAKPN